MERGGSKRGSSVTQEPRIRFQAGDLMSIEIEDFDEMRRGTTTKWSVAFQLVSEGKDFDKDTYTANTGKCS